MKRTEKALELKFDRMISASPSRAFAAWLSPKIPGNCWYEADKLIFNPTVGGFFYMSHYVFPHYGRFTRVERPRRVQYTWVSPNTMGEESMVTVTFRKKGPGTLMTLVHSDLPNNARGKMHNEGWNYYLDVFSEQLQKSSRKRR